MLQKLSSRKLWSAIIGVVSGIGLVATGNVVAGTSTIISSILGYMFTEGYIDAKAAAAAQQVVHEVEQKLQDNKEV